MEILNDMEKKLVEELGLEERVAAVPGVKPDPNAVSVEKRKMKAPAVIRGEFGDRPLSFARVVRAIYTKDWNEAKLENHIHTILEDEVGYRAQHGGRLVPLNAQFLEQYPKLKELGLSELMRVRAQGEDVLTSGGYLIKPEISDDVIELMRAQAVVEKAGAQVLDMPPGGQLDIPRITEGPRIFHVGEFEEIGEGEIKFGVLQLRSKYGGGLVAVSNRSLRHTEGLMEKFIRSELASALQLAQDYDFIAGAGTTAVPRGIINWPDIQTKDINGPITAEDLLRAEAKLLGANAFGPFAWIGNAQVLNAIRQLRGGALDSNDNPNYSVGPFLFVRDLVNGDLRNTVLGYPFYIANHIPTTAGKTYLILGQFDKAIIAREPVVEIAASEHVAFKQDMTVFKALLGYDFGLAQEAAFVNITRIAVS
jgi:HK97 family phage major capsid protein